MMAEAHMSLRQHGTSYFGYSSIFRSTSEKLKNINEDKDRSAEG
jgi:hypothetical protein